MSKAIRQGITSFAIFTGTVPIIFVVMHQINPSRPVLPTGESALVLSGTALMILAFSALRAIDSK